MTAEEFLCVRCARHMKTCCQTSEVYVSPGDEARIRAHSGQNDFTEFRTPDDPVYLLNDDDPLWRDRVFRPDGTRRILRRRENGDCVFLGAAGCVLPLETRPLVCRIYPYDYNEAGIKPALARGCPLELLPPGQDLTVALDMNYAQAEGWRKQLYEELLLEPDHSAENR